MLRPGRTPPTSAWLAAGLVVLTGTSNGCSDDDPSTSSSDEMTPCESEPERLTTPGGVEFVRTPNACFQALPAWPYAPRYVEIEGLRQAYVDEGPADGEVILLLHGQPSWSYLYRKMIPSLVDAGYRTIAMDHLGMGRSDKPTDIEYYTYLRHSQRLEGFIEALDLRDITVFVQDWGSLVGLRVAGLNINRFARIAIGNGDLPVVPAGTNQDLGIVDPEQSEDIVFPYANIPEQQPPFFDGCELLLNEVGPLFGNGGFAAWAQYAMKGASFRPGEVLEALTWFDLPDDEEAAYDAPFPSRIYLAGPRTFPSLAEQLSGLNEDAWAALSTFPRPLITLWGSNDPGNLGQCQTQDKYICNVPGAQDQAHARLPEAAHFLQDDQGVEIARRLIAFMKSDASVTANYVPSCEDETTGGFGATCQTDEDCAGQDANVCLSVPGQGGFCTQEGCDSGGCQAPFLCCRDCNPAAAGALPFEGSACIPEQASSQLSAGAGCTCD